MTSQDKKDSKTFSDEVCEILKRKSYTHTCYPLAHLTKAIEQNDKWAKNKVIVYKWLAFFLLLLIPLVSTFVSIAINMENGNLKDSVPIASVVLTFMTVINSIYRPRTRFEKSCDLSIKMDNFKDNLLVALEKFKEINEENLLTFESEQRANFKPYQQQLITMLLPESGAENISRLLGKGKGKEHKPS